MGLLTLAVVLYLGVTALVAVIAGLGARLEPAMRAGFMIGRVGAGAVAVVDAVTILRGHRPMDLTTHLAYVCCAVLLPWLLTSREVVRGEASPWVVAAASLATAVVLVRLAQTWA